MLERIARNRVASLLLVTLAVLLAVGAASPGFLAPGTAAIIWSNGLVLMLVSLGIFPVILTRNIDVSGGSVLGLSAVTLGLAVNGGAPLGAAIALALVVGTLAGALNGALVAMLRVPSIVATLGTLGLFRGLHGGAGRGRVRGADRIRAQSGGHRGRAARHRGAGAGRRQPVGRRRHGAGRGDRRGVFHLD